MFQKHVKDIARIINASILQQSDDRWVSYFHFDTRLIYQPEHSAFVALSGSRRDGHDYIQYAYDKGVRVFLVDKDIDLNLMPNANVLSVHDTLTALQTLAADYRKSLSAYVVGITGSNGKTIVKEWLTNIYSKRMTTGQSPKSYNSQLGVAISILSLRSDAQIAFIEAGISKPQEMDRLNAMIQPDIGIFTNIGSAHAEGFETKNQKLNEKLKLFKNARLVIYEKDNKIDHLIEQQFPPIRLFSWSQTNPNANVFMNTSAVKNAKTYITYRYKGNENSAIIPYDDQAHVQDALICLAFMCANNLPPEEIAAELSKLPPVSMRLEFKKGILGSTIINDGYNSDMNSMPVAIQTANNFAAGRGKVFIISEIFQSNNDLHDYSILAKSINEANPDVLLGVGKGILGIKNFINTDIKIQFYDSTESLIRHLDLNVIKDRVVLLKGARIFEFEKIVDHLEFRNHETELEINLTSLLHNLNLHHAKINKNTKMMVMVKASAYGSGAVEVARMLQHQQVDYLSVAYVDEGIELRKSGIHLPIMVMNTWIEHFEKMMEFDLEPEIFSINQINHLIEYLKHQNRKIKIHIKLDTGMHRLGFVEDELSALCDLVKSESFIEVASIFSHLAASGESNFDAFTQTQLELFDKMSLHIMEAIGQKPLRHILNSGGIGRFPQYQFDMVRLGIGLYGIDTTKTMPGLLTVLTLKSRVAQVKKAAKGTTVGYSRRWTAHQESTIATISIGYADGLHRSAGNEVWSVLIHGRLAPIIGSICMDMTMVDVTGIPGVAEGDEVIIFGAKNTAEDLAKLLHTIPYELFTSVSSRVKRTYLIE